MRKRLAAADTAGRWDGEALRLRQDDQVPLSALLTDDGWTLGELDEVSGYWDCFRGVGEQAALNLAVSHWAVTWAEDDRLAECQRIEAAAEAERRRIDTERRREEAIERARLAELQREALAIHEAWMNSGVPERLRFEASCGAGAGAGYFSGTAERVTALGQVEEHPAIDEASLRWKHLNLAILGPPGTGKSLLSAIWLRQHILASASGAFIDARSLTRRVIGARDKDAVLAEFAEIEKLVIDDICAEAEDRTPPHIGALIEVLNARSMAGAPTCFSSNSNPARLAKIFGPRGYSRLMHSALVLVLGGQDWRAPGVPPSP